MAKVLPFRFELFFGCKRLPCYLSKGPIKRDFLDIYLTTFFGVCKFKNTSDMRVILFLKFNLNFENARKNSKKNFFVSEMIADVAINCLY